MTQYGIDRDLIEAFLHSMEMDLTETTYAPDGYQEYIYGSAEVVGLMCLRIFCEGDAALYDRLKADARNDKEYYEQLERLQDGAIQDLIDRVLIIKEFRKDEKRHIPISYVDNAIADELAERFEGDRSKFLAFLRGRGKTIREHRRDKEEEIIYHYMQGQQRKSQSVVSPVRIETYYNENKDRFYREDEVHLRMIQLTRTDTDTDDGLKQQAGQIITRFKAGEKFEDLAKEFSRGTNRSKGGDWGWMQRSSFKPEFSEAAFNLKTGEASTPILLPEGCYILYAEDRHYAGIQPLDERGETNAKLLWTITVGPYEEVAAHQFLPGRLGVRPGDYLLLDGDGGDND